VAIQRAIMLIPNQGLDCCAVLDLAYEPGRDLDDARVLDICPQPPVGVLKGMNSGICREHISQLDREGALILE
jgi:hypothetical protein